MAIVKKVLSHSVLHGKISVGDEVLYFDDRAFSDILDYIFADSKQSGSLSIKHKGAEKVIYYEKENDYDTLGLEFDDSIEIKPIECHNNCIFCFVRQLPKGMRDTLYVKDDDYRLSFISGSYITCTNLQEKDMQRILDYKLSPLYVSVHATDENVRKFLLGIKKCPDQMQQLNRLIGGGITVHAQIVLVGGINDGEILAKSLRDLYEIGVKTVAIVPVGLTGHREGRYPLSSLTKEQAGAAIDEVESFYTAHPGFCYCSDEMYQIAERPVRGEDYYGQYEQIENGVGLISKFLSELDLALELAPDKKLKRKIGIITGVSGESTMIKAREAVRKKYPNVEINIYVVKNDFFGRTVTVTGLVTATDIIKQYGDRHFTEDFLMIPSVMMKEFEDVFLDGKTLHELSKALKKKILVSHCMGEDFLYVILEGRSKKR